jgi:hypothetical protein
MAHRITLKEIRSVLSLMAPVVSEYSAEPLPHTRSGVRPDRIGL